MARKAFMRRPGKELIDLTLKDGALYGQEDKAYLRKSCFHQIGKDVKLKTPIPPP